MVKTILVTGSTGWLGGKLCEALVARGVKVWGLARRVTHVAGVMSVRADLATGAVAALKEEFKPGVRQMNVTAEHAFIKDGCTVPQVMRTVYGPYVFQLDFSHYEQPGHERDALYDNALVREELGFVPKVNVLTSYKN